MWVVGREEPSVKFWLKIFASVHSILSNSKIRGWSNLCAGMGKGKGGKGIKETSPP